MKHNLEIVGWLEKSKNSLVFQDVQIWVVEVETKETFKWPAKKEKWGGCDVITIFIVSNLNVMT